MQKLQHSRILLAENAIAFGFSAKRWPIEEYFCAYFLIIRKISLLWSHTWWAAACGALFFFLKRMICNAQSVTLLLSQVIFFASQAQVGQMHCKIITAYPFLTEFKPILEIQKEHKNSHCPYTCSLKLRRYVSSWSCLKISLMIPWILRLGVHISWELGWAWHYERIFSLIYQSTNTRKK